MILIVGAGPCGLGSGLDKITFVLYTLIHKVV